MQYYKLVESTGLYMSDMNMADVAIQSRVFAAEKVELDLPEGIGERQAFLIDLEACASIRSEVDNNTGQKDFWEKGKVDIEMRVVIHGHRNLHEIFARHLGVGNSISIMSRSLGIYRNAKLVRSKFTEFDGRMVMNGIMVPTHLRMVMNLDMCLITEVQQKEDSGRKANWQ